MYMHHNKPIVYPIIYISKHWYFCCSKYIITDHKPGLPSDLVSLFMALCSGFNEEI